MPQEPTPYAPPSQDRSRTPLDRWSWVMGMEGLSPIQFSVLNRLAYHDGGDGAWPAVASMARQWGVSDKTVRRAIRGLVASGVISEVERPGKTTIYRMKLDATGPAPWTNGTGVQDETLDISDGGTLDISAPTLDKRVGGPWTSQTPEPGKNQERTKKGNLDTLGARARNTDDDVAWQAFNAMAGRVGLPQAQSFTATRRKHLRARMQEAGGIEGWIIACEKVEASEFLTGGGANGWTADIDFMLRASKFAKILEGSFDNRDRADYRDRSNAEASAEAIANMDTYKPSF